MPAVGLDRALSPIDAIFPVIVVANERLSFVAARNDVVHSAGKLNSQRSRQERILPVWLARCNTIHYSRSDPIYCSIYCFDNDCHTCCTFLHNFIRDSFHRPMRPKDVSDCESLFYIDSQNGASLFSSPATLGTMTNTAAATLFVIQPAQAVTTAQRERSFYSWLRRPIPPLLSLLKTADNPYG